MLYGLPLHLSVLHYVDHPHISLAWHVEAYPGGAVYNLQPLLDYAQWMPKHVNVCSPFYDTHLCRIKYFDGLLLKSYQSVCVECQRGSLNANMTFYVIVHDLYSTMWSNVLLSHRRWQIWWKMQHGPERAANNNNKQTQHKWNLEKVTLPTTLIPELYTPVTRRPLCQQISDIICPHWFLWAHILTELTRGLGRGCSLNWLLFSSLVFVFVTCQLAVHEK